MPEGYERLRDALKRKGKSDEEAKSMAAAIWNTHHKDDPVTNKKHLGLWPSSKPVFMLEEHSILLGIPEADFYRKAGKTLTDKLGRKLAQNAALSPQTKTGLAAPLQKFPSLPNPNPNAPSLPQPGPELESVLAYLKKRNMRSTMLPRSQGGSGWFPERGDIHDF